MSLELSLPHKLAHTPSILVLHLCHLFCSKCEKYSPTESNKANDKAANRKGAVAFDPQQVVDIVKQVAAVSASRLIMPKEECIKQYLEVSVLVRPITRLLSTDLFIPVRPCSLPTHFPSSFKGKDSFSLIANMLIAVIVAFHLAPGWLALFAGSCR